MPFRENPRIVRGLDYYGHTAFEFVTSKLGAQGTVMGGGRYDGLVEEMGGPPTPAVGWAAGIERLAMLLEDPPRAPSPVAVVPVGESAETVAMDVLQALRHAGIRAEMAYRGNLRRRMERANRIGARAAVVIWRRRHRAGGRAGEGPGERRAGGGRVGGCAAQATMNLASKLDRIAARADELRDMLTQGLSGEAYVKASKELADIEPVVARIGDLRAAEHAQQDAEALLADPEMRELAEAELHDLKERIPTLEHEIRVALLPKDAADERAAILEVRPAAGGDEAALFATELFAMYQRYAESRGWRFEILEYSDTELGGLKEGIAEITGRGVFARLKYESGVHRVQRVPTTESQGRIHTSTVTVAVLPEAEEVDVQVDETRSADRCLPRIRRWRAARQQDGKRGAGHAHAERNCGDDAGGEEPAQEPRQGDEDPAGAAL